MESGLLVLIVEDSLRLSIRPSKLSSLRDLLSTYLATVISGDSAGQEHAVTRR